MLYECPSDLIIICELEIFLGTKRIILLLIIIFSIVLMENILFSCDFSLTLVILKYVFNLQKKEADGRNHKFLATDFETTILF